ncbi:hypothetical protein DM75_2600 [Burkholderia mallei]|nr:hypothetical protein DM75_2600 [Burkholderia mallei]
MQLVFAQRFAGSPRWTPAKPLPMKSAKAYPFYLFESNT